MSSPYTSVSISGYNTSPPDDDGSQVASNQLKWSNHKEKLGDPIKTLAEGINTNVAAAFALIFGNGISSHSGNYSVLTTDQGKFFEATAALTFTLPAVASAGSGFSLAFVNNASTGNLTIDGSGAEEINGSTTVTLLPGAGAILTCNGSKWVAVTTLPNVFTGYGVTHNSVSSSAGTLTLDLSTGNSFYCLMTENITTVTVTNEPASGTYGEWNLILEQDPSTAYTVTWSSTYLFPAGVDHVMSTTLGASDILHGFTVDGGTTHHCAFRKGSA